MIVFDASTLILLAKASALREVLASHQAIIPPIVQRECTVEESREDSKMIAQMIEEGLLVLREPRQPAKITRLAKDFQLDRGEATALLLALEQKAALATDDLLALKACRILNTRSIIALAFLERLVQRRLLSVERALEKLKKLKRYGRYRLETLEAAKANIRKGG